MRRPRVSGSAQGRGAQVLGARGIKVEAAPRVTKLAESEETVTEAWLVPPDPNGLVSRADAELPIHRLGVGLDRPALVDHRHHDADGVADGSDGCADQAGSGRRLHVTAFHRQRGDRDHEGQLGRRVKSKGRALARHETQEIIRDIKRRAAAQDLNRGLSLSLPYFDDQALGMKLHNFQVIPAGRIMFDRSKPGIGSKVDEDVT